MGLLIALITFTANGPAFASFDLGLESSFDEFQAVVIFEENIHVTSSGHCHAGRRGSSNLIFILAHTHQLVVRCKWDPFVHKGRGGNW